MDRSTVPKRPRGRPPKVKRKQNGPSADAQKATSCEQSIDLAGKVLPQVSGFMKKEISNETSTATPTGSKRSSPDTDEYVLPAKRSRLNSSQNAHTLAFQSSESSIAGVSPAPSEAKARSIILPARRSTRHATVQSTQISEGTLRPPGPPNLEAALIIALRNLESETWRYLWAYNKKHPSGPLPTPAGIKEASPLARKAADAVDKADRELEDAIDDIILSNSKKKGRVSARSAKIVEIEYGAGINTALADSTATASTSNTVLTPASVAMVSERFIPPIRIPGMVLKGLVHRSTSISEATT